MVRGDAVFTFYLWPFSPLQGKNCFGTIRASWPKSITQYGWQKGKMPIGNRLKASVAHESRPTTSEVLAVMAHHAQLETIDCGNTSEVGISGGNRHSVFATYICVLFLVSNFVFWGFRLANDSANATELVQEAAKQERTFNVSDAERAEFNELKEAVTSLAAAHKSGFRSVKSLLVKVLRRVTPSKDGYEKLLAGFTKTQRDMYEAGFALLDQNEVRRPRTAAVRVFREFARRRVTGRYENEASFCALFARVYGKYMLLPRI